jgi:uncharacterized membrane-anchored protein YhcB (DUF1043 family)
MKAGHWVAMIVALVVGVIIGFAAGSNPVKTTQLEQQIAQLTKENAELKSRLATPAAPALPAPAVQPAPAGKK